MNYCLWPLADVIAQEEMSGSYQARKNIYLAGAYMLVLPPHPLKLLSALECSLPLRRGLMGRVKVIILQTQLIT